MFFDEKTLGPYIYLRLVITYGGSEATVKGSFEPVLFIVDMSCVSSSGEPIQLEKTSVLMSDESDKVKTSLIRGFVSGLVRFRKEMERQAYLENGQRDEHFFSAKESQANKSTNRLLLHPYQIELTNYFPAPAFLTTTERLTACDRHSREQKSRKKSSKWLINSTRILNAGPVFVHAP